MENLEVSARTVEEAIKKALTRLGASREEVEVTVIKEGKAGILGMGAEDALISVKLLSEAPEPLDDTIERVRGILESLLAKMGVSGVEISRGGPLIEDEEEKSPIVMDITGDDPGILIGRRGQTLASLQYITRLIVSNQTRRWVPIIIDVQGYKERRYQALRDLAERIVQQVKATGMPFTLEPMPAYERRIIHLALLNHPDVTTQSIYEGDARRVVVSPRKQ